MCKGGGFAVFHLIQYRGGFQRRFHQLWMGLHTDVYHADLIVFSVIPSQTELVIVLEPMGAYAAGVGRAFLHIVAEHNRPLVLIFHALESGGSQSTIQCAAVEFAQQNG